MTRPSRMSRERWQLLEPLLDRALEFESPQRDRFLDDTCAGDIALRAELDALLSACEHGAAMFTVAAVEQFAPFIAAGIEDPPTVLGRYQIIRQVGRGGMATVYLATDPKHGRQVAVKVLHAHVAMLVGASRFAREIEIAARLSHPNILPLHDSSDTGAGSDSVLYYVTPFMTGESLRDRLRRGSPLPLDEVERLVDEIAGALDYAHREGVVHCDIKPENILLQEGHAVVADFGIARVLSETVPVDPASRLGLAFGTPAYMSPEQATGDVALDGRSDVYSLGCVLRDMLGPMPDAAGGAPSAIAQVIARATASDRDARYATAGELARAFRSAGAGSISAAPRLRRRVATILVVAVGILGALAVLVLRRERPAPNAYRVAVAPFDVVDTSLSLWSEGLVDVLSRNLDGAGPLTAVPPSLVVRRWQGRADVASVRALGVRTGASLVLYGGLLSAGDSVRVTVGILDTESGQTLGSIERRDLPERMDRLTDSLTLSVLRELGRARRIEASRANFAPTRSLVALKEYLQGEQFYRRADWDSAQQRYQQAADADSSFALAYHRLAGIADLRAPEAFGNAETTDLLLRASRLRRGASPGDSLLLHIDSLRAAADLALRERVRTRASVVHEATVQELLSTLAKALRANPQDAELALLYALSRTWHEQWAAIGEVDDRSMLASYDAAIRLDSSFAPSYIVPIALAAHLDGAAGARRYLQGYLSARHRTEPAAAMRLAYALLDPVPEARPNIDSLLSQLSPSAMCEIGALLQRVPDDAETSVRMFRGALAAQERLGKDGPPVCAPVGALYAYLFRGHLREAARLVPETDNWLRGSIMLDLTRFNMVSTDSTRALFARLFTRAPGAMSADAYRWWAYDRDTMRIVRYIDYFRQDAAQKSAGRSFALLQRAAAASGTAFLALARADTAGAVAQLLAVPDSMQLCWSASREALADLLLKSGRHAQAIPLLSRQWAGTSRCGNPVTDVVWTMHRARAFDVAGRREEAIASYDLVRRAWKAADAELQPLVREADSALLRLRRAR